MSHTLNLELPLWLVQALDQEAANIGIPRRALINVILYNNLKSQGYLAPGSPKVFAGNADKGHVSAKRSTEKPP